VKKQWKTLIEALNSLTEMRSNGGKARAKSLTKARRVEIARAGGKARAAKLSPAKRRQIARKAGQAKGKSHD
jgi:general stress protein YciG